MEPKRVSARAQSSKEKQRAYDKEWKRKWRELPENREKNRTRAAAWHARKRVEDPHYLERRCANKFGITLDKYLELRAEFGGRCHICKDTLRRGKGGTAVDHDHGTGAVRGLLCGGCNKGIGQLQDNPRVLRAAADYLDKHGKREILEE